MNTMARSMGATTLQGSHRLTVGPLVVAADESSAVVAGRRVWLTPRELALLMVLAGRPDTPVSRATLRQAAWGSPLTGKQDRLVEVYVHKLRVKLAEAAPTWSFIHTHHMVGYRLAPEPLEDPGS